MPDDVHALTRSINLLAKSENFDLAAGLSEASLNDFLAAHWSAENSTSSNVYKGQGRIADLALTYAYAVTAPAEIHLAPLTQRAFQIVFQGWLKTVPELARFLELPADLPSEIQERGTLGDKPLPNVQVVVPQLTLTIDTDNGIHVSLNLRMKVTGYVSIETTQGNTVIRIVPIDARIEDQNALKEQIDNALSNQGAHRIDDPNCIELRKLILYIANIVLANRIGSFIKEFGLPLPITLFPGVSLTHLDLQIIEHLLVVLGKVSAINVHVPATAWDGRLSDTTADNVGQTVSRMQAEWKSWYDETAGKKENQLPLVSMDTKSNWPNRGIFMLMHERFFQVLADKLLVISQSKEDCGSW
jgi:hypothetical protein